MKTQLLIIALVVLMILAGCGGGKNNNPTGLTIGQILGPGTPVEQTAVQYSVVASGDTGIKYIWACDPAAAGTFENATSQTATFHAGPVAITAYVKIRVAVSSDNHGPEMRALDITISAMKTSGWAKTWGGTKQTHGYGIDTDKDGNVYVTGRFSGYVDFDPSPDVSTHTSNGGDDVFLSKFNPFGALVWSRAWGGPSDDNGWRVLVGKSGDLYVTGVFDGTVDFDQGPGEDIHTSMGAGDAFLCKYNSVGDFIWARTWGGPDGEHGYGLAEDSSGNVLVTGFYGATVDFDPGAGVTERTSNGLLDCFMSKFDSSGNFISAQVWGGSDNDKSYQVVVDENDNAYLTGWFYTTVDFDPGAGVNEVTSLGLDDTFVLKLDSSGAFVWVSTWGGTESDGGGHGIVYDGNGRLYICGHFRETVDFDPGPGTANHVFHGMDDGYVTSIDTSGNFLWARSWGSSTGAWSFGLDVDESGVVVTGLFGGTVDFGAGGGIDNHTSNGTGDIFVSKFNPDGGFQWAKTWGGASENDNGHTVAIDANGSIYVTGRFAGTADFDPTAWVEEHTSVGEIDAFLIKMMSDGSW